MNIKNKIMDYLMISSDKYDDMIYQTYFVWCHKRASSDSKLQELLSNAIVNRWFLRQYSNMELKFIESYEAMPSKVRDTLFDYYNFTLDIYNIYPIDLIQGLKVNKDYSFKLNDQTTIYAN